MPAVAHCLCLLFLYTLEMSKRTKQMQQEKYTDPAINQRDGNSPQKYDLGASSGLGGFRAPKVGGGLLKIVLH